jgi:hypothetical protein
MRAILARLSLLYLWLSQFGSAARASAALSHLHFRIRRSEYSVSEWVRSERLQSGALRQLIMRAVPTLIMVGLVAGAIAWLDSRLRTVGIVTAPLAQAGTYAEVMIGIASMGAVFIGLYYAALSAVATRAYADVSTRIRVLLASDIAGRTYMRLLTFVTCFALLHLALQVTVDYRSGTSAATALLLGASCVVVFVLLGNRAFHLLDPYNLVDEVSRDFDHWVDRVTRGRLRSSEEAFQQHAHAQADASISTLEAIADRSMAALTTLSSRVSTISPLCRQLLFTELRYISKKAGIPIASRWYARANVHRRWFTTSDTITSVAAQTDTGLPPEIRADYGWVEKRCDRIVEKLLVSLSRPSYLLDLSNCLIDFSEALRRRAVSGDIAGATATWRTTAEAISTALVTNKADGADQTVVIGVADQLGASSVSIAVGFREYMERIALGLLRKEAATLEGYGYRRFSFQRCPFHLVERVDWLVERIAFEIRVEDHIISPGWYQWELISQVEVQHLERALATITQEIAAHFVAIRKILGNSGNPLLEAAMVERQLEFYSKARLCVTRAAERFKELSVNRRVTGLPWATVDEKLLRKKLDEHEAELVDQMATLSIRLAEVPFSETLPDYRGRFLAKLAAAAFDAVVDGQVERFGKLFPALTIATVKLSDELRAGVIPAEEMRMDPRLVGSVAAIAELLDIAGYAAVFSELHGKPALWASVVSTLNGLFNQNRAQIGSFLRAVLRFSSYGGFTIPHMSTFRLWRRQRLSESLAPYADRRGSSYRFGAKVNHPSPVVRIMASEAGMGPEGLDLFALQYVHGELNVPTSALGYRVERMARDLARSAGDDDGA